MFNWLKKPKNVTPEIPGDWYFGKWCYKCQVGMAKDAELCPKCGAIMKDAPIVRCRIWCQTYTNLYLSHKFNFRHELHSEDFMEGMQIDRRCVLEAGKKDWEPYKKNFSEPHIPKTDPPEPPPGSAMKLTTDGLHLFLSEDKPME